MRQLAATYWPERVERLTGVPQAELIETARTLGSAERVIVLTGRGPEQQSQGVNNALAYINIALALGQVGTTFGGYGTITGQGNGQGGREHGQKADQLPGYRKIDDPLARRHMAAVWDVREDSIPGPGKPAFELLDTLGRDDGVRALLVIGSNVLVSAPDAERIKKRLESLDLLVVSEFFLSETAALADVVLPSAQWAEEDGTTTNLEGRVLRRRRALDPPPNVRTDLEMLVDLAGRLGRGRWFPTAAPSEVFEELRRASEGGIADYSGHHLRPDRRGGRRVLAVSRPRSSGYAAAVRGPIPDGQRPRAVSRRRAPAAGGGSRQRLSALPHHRPGARAVSVRHADAGASPRCRRSRRSRSRSCTR